MAKPVNMDDSGDSADLQTLFDTIAAGSTAPAPEPVAAAGASGDNADLQALFDTVAAQTEADEVTTSRVAAGAAACPPTTEEEAVFNSLGQMARQLHDSLRALGYDKMLEDTAQKIPDARQRLAYITEMTDKAASRVLNATDIAKPLQDELLARSKALEARWEQMFANRLSVDEFKSLAADSRAYFKDAPGKLDIINAQTLEITMAQDFQDLTGQVIKKVVDLVQGLESQLLKTLIEAMPAEKKAEAPASLLNGPVINVSGCDDVVTSQEQVDELLESLGF